MLRVLPAKEPQAEQKTAPLQAFHPLYPFRWGISFAEKSKRALFHRLCSRIPASDSTIVKDIDRQTKISTAQAKQNITRGLIFDACEIHHRFKTERNKGMFPRGSMMRSKVRPVDRISMKITMKYD